MKHIKLIALFILTVFISKSYAQSIGYKDLIGTWEKVNSGNEKLTFQFKDSSNVKITSPNGESSNAILHLAGKVSR